MMPLIDEIPGIFEAYWGNLLIYSARIKGKIVGDYYGSKYGINVSVPDTASVLKRLKKGKWKATIGETTVRFNLAFQTSTAGVIYLNFEEVTFLNFVKDHEVVISKV